MKKYTIVFSQFVEINIIELVQSLGTVINKQISDMNKKVLKIVLKDWEHIFEIASTGVGIVISTILIIHTIETSYYWAFLSLPITIFSVRVLLVTRKMISESYKEKSSWECNMPDGMNSKYYPNSTQTREMFTLKKGKRHGSSQSYDENGQLKFEVNYDNGEKHGSSRGYYENGQLKYEVNYENGKKQGSSRDYYENGQLKFEDNYDNGKKQGASRGYYKNSQLKFEINYDKGCQVGKTILYNQSNILLRKSKYSNGSLNESTEYYENGNVRMIINESRYTFYDEHSTRRCEIYIETESFYKYHHEMSSLYDFNNCWFKYHGNNETNVLYKPMGIWKEFNELGNIVYDLNFNNYDRHTFQNFNILKRYYDPSGKVISSEFIKPIYLFMERFNSSFCYERLINKKGKSSERPGERSNPNPVRISVEGIQAYTALKSYPTFSPFAKNEEFEITPILFIKDIITFQNYMPRILPLPFLLLYVKKAIKNIENTTLEFFEFFIGGKLEGYLHEKMACHITALDITDSKEEIILSTMELWKKSDDLPVFTLVTDDIPVPKNGTFLKRYIPIAGVPILALKFPKKGLREIKFTLDTVSLGTKIDFATYILSYNNEENGYLDEVENREIFEKAVIQAGLFVSACDGDMDSLEAAELKQWVKERLYGYKSEESNKERLNNYIKDNYGKVLSGNLDLEEILLPFNKVAEENEKYELLEVCLRIAKSDGIAEPEELEVVEKIANYLDLDKNRFRTLRDKILPIDIYSEMDEMSNDDLLGINSDMSKDEIKKHLAQEFKKWNQIAGHKDQEKRKQAENMIQLIAKAKKKYK